MRFSDYLQEEYVIHVKGTWSKRYSGDSDVFENPSKKELNSLTSDVRFIVNYKSKKMYAWNWDITHTEMAGYLYKEKLIPIDEISNIRFMKTCYAGVGKVKSGKIEHTRQSDCLYGVSKYWKWFYDESSDDWTELYFTESLKKSIKNCFGIKEEYQSMVRRKPVFVNPTVKEIKEIGTDYVRCIADFSKKNLYVFDYNIIHEEVMRQLESEIGLYSWRDWDDTKNKASNYYSFCTSEVLSNGKLKFYRSDTGAYWYRTGKLDKLKWLKMSDTWLTPWFGTGYKKDFIEGCKNPADFR